MMMDMEHTPELACLPTPDHTTERERKVAGDRSTLETVPPKLALLTEVFQEANVFESGLPELSLVNILIFQQ